ncbi:MAG: hypothetical protein ABIO72_03660 [Patescibacteria group bacterium]
MATRSTPAKKNPVRSRPAAQDIRVAPRILSEEEKHQLIRAHARARQPVDRRQQVTLWAGVAVCIAFVVGAWLYTVGSGIKKSFAGQMDPNLKHSLELSKQFADETASEAFGAHNELHTAFDNIASQLDILSSDSDLIDSMASQISASSSATSSPQLFKASPSSASAPTSTH